MSGKRGATSELTDRNWDVEDEPEERGTFVQADKSEISRRVIKVGKRRSQAETPASTGIFSGFAGFKPSGNVAPTKSENPSVESAKTLPLFNFTPTSDGTKASSLPIFKSPTDQPVDGKETNNNITSEPFKNQFASNSSILSGEHVKKPAISQSVNKLESLTEDSKKFEKERHSKTFQHKLGSLNRSVVKWIVAHVEENDCVDLTPVFADYGKHLKKIDDEYQKALKELSPCKSSTEESQNNRNESSIPGKSAFAFLNKANADKTIESKPLVFGANNNSITGSNIFSSSLANKSPAASGNIFSSSNNSASTNLSSANEASSVSPLTSTNNSSSFPKGETTPKFGSSDVSAGVKPGLFAGLVNPSASITGNSTAPVPSLFPSTVPVPGDEAKPASIFPTNFNFKPADTSQLFGANLFKPPTANGADAQPTASLVTPSIFGSLAPPKTNGSVDATKCESNNAVANSGDQEAAESEEPPKNDFTEVTEPGAYYSVRCKMFFKKGSEWKSKAVGMLHFKKLEDKTQLVLRADTNLGNIFLNIILDPNTPIKLAGKTNISMVTVANPPVEDKCPQCGKKYIEPQTSNECETEGCTPKPTTLMFKVKTEEECQKFFQHLQKIKDSS